MKLEGVFLRHMSNGKLLVAVSTKGDDVEYVELPPPYREAQLFHGKTEMRADRTDFKFGQRLEITIKEAQ